MTETNLTVKKEKFTFLLVTTKGETYNFIKLFLLWSTQCLSNLETKIGKSYTFQVNPVVNRTLALFYLTAYDSAFRKHLNIGNNVSHRLELLIYEVRCE